MYGATQRLTRLPPLLHDPVEPPPSRWELPDSGPIDSSGLVAVGADLQPGTLLAAYRTGLFPMPFDRRRVAWFSPDPRGILPLDGVHVSRSLGDLRAAGLISQRGRRIVIPDMRELRTFSFFDETFLHIKASE